MSTEIIRSQTPEEEELTRKLGELAELEAELAERELDIATLMGELHLFERRYLRVGALYAELDDVLAQIAEIRARHEPSDAQARKDATSARARASESAHAAGSKGGTQDTETQAKFEPSESLRKLYRDIARRIHPDLTTDEDERARRTRLMAEVNRAYEEGDEVRLRAILQEWESSPEAVIGQGPGVELVRTIRKIAQVRSRLDAIESEMDQLKESPMCTLRTKIDEAEASGRDLLAEMAIALDAQIAQARANLSREL